MKRITYVVDFNGTLRSYAGYVDAVPNNPALYSGNIIDDKGVNVFSEAGSQQLMLEDIEEFANVNGVIVSRTVLECPALKKKPVKKLQKKKIIRRKK